MKSVFQTLLFCLLSAATFSISWATPAIKLSVTVIDLGEVQESGGIISKTIPFVNTGTDSLQLIALVANCNCITVTWTKTLVAPGSSGTIKIDFDPRDRTGLFNKHISVISTAKNSPETIELKGNVLSAYSNSTLEYTIGELATQSKHINLGYIFKGEVEDKDLRIANYTEKALKVELTGLPQYISARVIPETLKPGEYGTVEIVYNSNYLNDWDIVIDRLILKLNGKTDTTQRLTVTANIRENFNVLNSEQRLLAPVAVFPADTSEHIEIHDNETITCKFLLENKGKSELIIRSVKASCGCMALKPEKNTLSPGESTHIVATYKPEMEKGEFVKNLTVITNDPVNYKQFLWIKGVVID